jgi:hypothetical protein
MIKHFLRRLRQQPKSTRDNIALVIAGSLSGVVAMVWLYHAPVKIGEGTAGMVSGDENSQPGFMNMFSDFSSQMATVKESFTEVQETLVEEEAETTSTAEELPLEEEIFQNESVIGGGNSDTATPIAPTTQPRAIRIITTSDNSSEVETSENE